MFSYQLARSAKRKTLAISVKEGQVFVRAPHFLSQAQIDEFLLQKSQWIGQKLQRSISEIATKQELFKDGTSVMFDGKLTEITYISKAKSPVIYHDSRLFVEVSDEIQEADRAQFVKEQLASYFQEVIETKIFNRLPYWVEQTKLAPVDFKVRQYKSRWGSCNSRRQLTFNSLLAMMSDQTIDYIIVHELCHLRHMNHSSAFWQLVGQYMPDFNEHRQWIKTHQRSLSVFA